jgi:hypothetical protein
MKFVRIATLSAASVVLSLAAGCTVTVAEPPIPAGMTAACGTDGTLMYTAGFKPAVKTDFSSIVRERTDPQFGTQPTTLRSVELSNDRSGVQCMEARNVDKCNADLLALSVIGPNCQGLPVTTKSMALLGGSEAADVAGAMAPQPQGMCNAEFLAYSRGDEVGLVSTIAQAQTFFGGIDSAQEAMYIAKLSGEPMSCAGSAPVAYRAIDGGYEVQTSNVDTCGNTVSRRIVFVSATGTVTLRSNKALTNPCAGRYTR